MNPTEVNTMKFFDEVLEAHQNLLISAMADAVAECRTADTLASTLNEEGETGLFRLIEIWCAIQPAGNVLVLEGSGTQLLADVLAQVYAYIILHPMDGPAGLAIYLELHHMVDGLMLGEWFE